MQATFLHWSYRVCHRLQKHLLLLLGGHFSMFNLPPTALIPYVITRIPSIDFGRFLYEFDLGSLFNHDGAQE
jgi:hypothetical protein